jgi:hypothetical protein
MFGKILIALAVIAATASAAATKQTSRTPTWEEYDCPGVPVGSNTKILINRPQSGMCDPAE